LVVAPAKTPARSAGVKPKAAATIDVITARTPTRTPVTPIAAIPPRRKEAKKLGPDARPTV
jgi:hypothetical protein